MNTILIITFLIFIFFISVYRSKFLFAVSIISSAPNLLLLGPVLVGFQVAKWFNNRALAEGRLTIWYKICNRFILLILNIKKRFAIEYNNSATFLIGEKMAIEVEEPGAPITYVPKSERGDDVEDPAKFTLEKLDASEKAQIRDGVVGVGDGGQVEKYRSNQVQLKMVIEMLSGWENIKKNGEPIEFDPSDPEESFNKLPSPVQDELMDEFGSMGSTEEGEEE